MTQETLREAVARAICRANWPNFSESDINECWDGYLNEADAAIATMLERLRTPSDAACVGLARDIMMWLDMEPKTPRALFKHLERIGREIPQGLRDEPEMQSLDHVPSKATRCAIIWQAMLAAFQQENSDER